ncbi:MAG: DUF262 domain-containing protein [Saprospiraceae bacterium]|nr:DUF262 domain-containing protein [Saprospiraceae bacterium]
MPIENTKDYISKNTAIVNDENDDVESEKNDDVVISHPFDPSLIRITPQPFNIGQLLERLEHREINLDTEFQRAFVWDKIRQSQFIESIIMRLPIPTFYFDGTDENRWQVIDGLQRTSTLKEFALDKSLRLIGLEFLKDEFEGKGYEDLPRNVQRQIKAFPITVHVIERGTPDVVKYNIFSRINRGGLVLRPQEIRHALYQGVASRLVKELAEDDTFIKATQGKIKKTRMEDRDFANRFAAFYVLGENNYEPDLDSFMSKGMSQLQKLKTQEENSLKLAFRKAMNIAFEIFGNDAFRKRFNESDQRKPINKALFEVLSVSFSKLSDNDSNTLKERKEKFKKLFINEMNSPRFLRSITQGTALKENVDYRFSSIKFIIEQTLNND